MIRFSTLAAVLVLLSVSAISEAQQERWVRQPSPDSRWLYRASFADTSFGWVVGDSGVVIHTSDGGQNWVVQQSGIIYFIEDVFFLNRRLGWAISNDYLFTGTIMLKTTNGGVNWTYSRYPDTTLIFNTIHFQDSLTGFMGGYDGVIYRTSNNGASWAEVHVDSNSCSFFPIRKFTFCTPLIGYACGGIFDISGVVWRTTDGGLNWKDSCISPEPLFDLKCIISPLRVIAAGGDFDYGAGVSTSTDGGISWRYNYTGIWGAAQTVAPRTLAEIWLPMGFSGRWGISYDTGSTWLEIPTPDSQAVYDALFFDSTRGWAFGWGGSIYKYVPEPIGISWNGENIPRHSVLFQNYPNPFNPSTTIFYDISKPSAVRLTVYDLTGRVLRVLNEGYKPAGRYSIKFRGDEFSSGIYLYRLEAGEYRETKKMVLLK